MTVLKLTVFSFALAVVAAAIVIVDASNNTADADFKPATIGSNIEQLCNDPATNLVSVASVSLFDDSELIPPPHHNSYMPPPKCRKVKTSCAKYYRYVTIVNGKPVKKETCDKWNYRWECG